MAFAPASHIKSDHINRAKNDEDTQRKNLNFYESIYHFKKMFPKFDIEVIEQILRANDGSVEKTIDQLLLMASDYETIEKKNEYKVDLALPTTSSANNRDGNYPSLSSSNNNSELIFESRITSDLDSIYSHDLPPSYNEFMSSISHTASRRTSITSSTIETVILSDAVPKSSEPEHIDSKKTPLIVESVASKTFESEFSFNVENMNVMPSTSNGARFSISQANTLSNMKSRIMIGEMPNDFLRIKLTAEQVKKLKTTIKIAKRNELTAIMNEKIPEVPDKKPLSIEMREKLNMFKEHSESKENREKEYDSNERERIQIIQDEYLAKIIQNEEFLCELKQNKDFMQTLDSDNRLGEHSTINGWESGDNKKNYSISNAELKKKLLKMSKTTRVKFLKLATTYTKKVKLQCNKTAIQVAATCSNIFSSQIKSLEYYNSNYNDLNGNRETNRYQKAYKSLKTAIKGNSSKSESSTTNCSDKFDALMMIRNGSKSPLDMPTLDGYGYDHLEKQQKSILKELAKEESFQLNGTQYSSINRQPGEIDFFRTGYSYDDETDKDKDYTYDHSVYPKAKVFKTPSKNKIPDDSNRQEK